MPKHIDSVPKLDSFRPPWQTEDGSEVEIDKDKLKRYIHNLVLDKAKAQDARDEQLEKVTLVETERDELKAQVDSKDPDSGKRIAKLEKQLEEAQAKAAKAEFDATRTAVIADKGLNETQVKYLQGSTKEELEANADQLIKDFGTSNESDDDDDDDDPDEAAGIRRSPATNRRLVSPGDPSGEARGPQEVDYEKVVDTIRVGRVL